MPLGRRIAALRKERGMSQKELAAEMGRSESWVSQVERGVHPLDRLSVLQAMARALGVSIGELRADSAEAPAEPQATPTNDLDGVRLALTGHPALGTLFGDGPTGGETPVESLHQRVDHVWALAHRAAYGELSDELSKLLPELESRVRQPDSTDEIHTLLARAYQAAAATLARQDEPDAAWVAADRAIQAAERAGEPLEVVAGVFRLAHTFLRIQTPMQAEKAAQGAIDVLQRQAEGGTLSVEGLSLYGAFHLVQAVISAREGDRAATHRWINQAREIAGQIGEDRNDWETEFGPTNVEIHAVSTSVDLGDAGMALELAEGLDTSRLSPERRGRFLLDTARAHLQRRQVGEALNALLESEKLAPEQIRAHALARQAIRDLLQLSGHRPPRELVALAERAAVA
ncbi:helix-turn-helix transcriptional regulator [Nocardiopsis rhodophaea]